MGWESMICPMCETNRVGLSGTAGRRLPGPGSQSGGISAKGGKIGIERRLREGRPRFAGNTKKLSQNI